MCHCAMRCDFLLVVVLLSGCASEQLGRAEIADTVAFDVTTATAPSTPLDETMHPTRTIGGLQSNPGDEIGAIAGMVSLSAGRLVLIEEQRVRLFDSTGTERWRYGQPGAGPGDFRLLSAPCRFHGDTLVAMDVGNSRLAYIVAEAGVIATRPVARTRMRDGACSGQGDVLLTRQAQDSLSGAPLFEVWLYGGPTAAPRRIHATPGPVPGTVGAAALSVGFSDTLVFVGDPNRGEILLLTRGGAFHRLLQWSAPRIAVTDANIPELYGRAPRNATPEEAESYWAQVTAWPRTAHWPAFLDVAAASRGQFWLWPMTNAGHDSVIITVLSVEGKLLGRIAIPRSTSDRRLYLLALLAEGVAIVHTDGDGADRISIVPYPTLSR